MAGMEQAGPQDQDAERARKVAERTAELAQHEANQARINAEIFLEPHLQAGRLTEDQAKEIMEAEETNAIEEYILSRNNGLRNDNSSLISTGLTIWLSARGKTCIDSLERELRPIPEPCHTGSVDDNNRGSDLYRLSLPLGAYIDRRGKVMIFEEAELGNHVGVSSRVVVSGRGLMQLPYDGVVRIEGNGGELWQNFEFKPDGTLAD